MGKKSLIQMVEVPGLNSKVIVVKLDEPLVIQAVTKVY